MKVLFQSPILLQEPAARYHSYIVMLHAMARGAVRPSLPTEVREIFAHDREILKELAK